MTSRCRIRIAVLKINDSRAYITVCVTTTDNNLELDVTSAVFGFLYPVLDWLQKVTGILGMAKVSRFRICINFIFQNTLRTVRYPLTTHVC